jgi:hypothetical protein
LTFDLIHGKYMARFIEVIPKPFCDSLYILGKFDFGIEWVDEIATYCCWSLGLKIRVSYTGNTTLIRKAKINLAGLFIRILTLLFYLTNKYYLYLQSEKPSI